MTKEEELRFINSMKARGVSDELILSMLCNMRKEASITIGTSRKESNPHAYISLEEKQKRDEQLRRFLETVDAASNTLTPGIGTRNKLSVRAMAEFNALHIFNPSAAFEWGYPLQTLAGMAVGSMGLDIGDLYGYGPVGGLVGGLIGGMITPGWSPFNAKLPYIMRIPLKAANAWISDIVESIPINLEESLAKLATKVGNVSKTAGRVLDNASKALHRRNNNYLNTPLTLDFSKVKESGYYKALVNLYGLKQADAIIAELQSPEFSLYFVGDDPIQAMNEINTYHRAMDIHSRLGGDPEHGMGVAQGSASISGEGTIFRKGAPHDLDFKAYIKDAAKSKVDIGDELQVQDNLRILFRNEGNALNEAPVIERLFKEYGKKPFIFIPKGYPRWATPKSKNHGVYATRMFGISEPYGIHRTVMTSIDGYPVDFFLTNNKIYTNQHVSGLGSSHEPLYWKAKWNLERTVPRPKDVADIENFAPYSEDNPVFDLSTGQGLYSPFMFGRRILTREGYPIVKEIETYPGSGIKVPVVMNWKGQFKLVGLPSISEAVLMNSFKKGSKIHIKKKNEGKFTASAKAAGESVLEHARKVLNNPNATPLLKKRANFARNAAKWNH